MKKNAVSEFAYSMNDDAHFVLVIVPDAVFSFVLAADFESRLCSVCSTNTRLLALPQRVRDGAQHLLVHLAVALPVALHPLVLLRLTPPPHTHVRSHKLVQRERRALRRRQRHESHAERVLLHRQEADLPLMSPTTPTIVSLLSSTGN